MLGNLESIFNGSFPLTISIYIVLLLSVVGVTTLLSRLCLVLKDKAHLSDGIVAGIILGVITSLPELITCLTSVISSKNGAIGVGDIVGSNSFDLFILAICLLVCVWLFITKKVNKINMTSLICTGVGTIFVLMAAIFGDHTEMGVFQGNSPLVWHGFNFFSIPIFLSYAAAIFFMVRSNKHKEKPANKNEGLTEIKQAKRSRFHKLPVWAISLLVAVVAIVLITISVILTVNATSLINYHWGMNGGFGGSLLLGVCTSLPEIVACANLCISREYNMTIDTMVGSTAFNLSILAISNIALACVYDGSVYYDFNKQQWVHQIMYQCDIDSITQLSLCSVIVIACIVYLVINTPKIKAKLSKKVNLGLNVGLLSLVILAYIAWIILGFIYYKQII